MGFEPYFLRTRWKIRISGKVANASPQQAGIIHICQQRGLADEFRVDQAVRLLSGDALLQGAELTLKKRGFRPTGGPPEWTGNLRAGAPAAW